MNSQGERAHGKKTGQRNLSFRTLFRTIATGIAAVQILKRGNAVATVTQAPGLKQCKKGFRFIFADTLPSETPPGVRPPFQQLHFTTTESI